MDPFCFALSTQCLGKPRNYPPESIAPCGYPSFKFKPGSRFHPGQRAVISRSPRFHPPYPSQSSSKSDRKPEPPNGYGIEKLECCGHVQKKTGKRLIDKVEKCKEKVYAVENKKSKEIGDTGRLTKNTDQENTGTLRSATRANLSDLEEIYLGHTVSETIIKCLDYCDGLDKSKLPDLAMEEIKSEFEDLSN
ncbi:hypothetical protein PoB_000512900 [Plakobranchus ocellatus]|uniref:Uncharacterized protein n=1 Tax=Plakobranchus ocellatus TaxID=259542 RepID=A0AAV3Y988_9GAST|nr:hypothetical protein PoB_000512900 [Plakobranchus ocellatus]